MSVQSLLVFLFCTSLFTNLLILITSRAHGDHVVNDLDLDIISPDGSIVSWDRSRGSPVRVSRESKLKLLKDCVRDKMARSKHTANNLSSSFAVPSYKRVKLPASVDKSVLASFNWTIQSEFRRLKSVFTFLSRPVIFKHDFNYIHNPQDACLKRQIDLVIAVPSSAEHAESRHRTRQGLKGSYSFVKSNNATLLFFLGVSNHQYKSRKFQVDINMEMRMFGDIVQESFIDVYRNLTLKSISVLKWIDRFCPHAQFVIKADDDVGIKPAVAVSALQRYQKQFGNFILGRWNPMNKVARNNSAKTYVSLDEYPYATFPPHLLGGVMGFPVSTARLLYQAALRVKRVWLDDVFLSAICAPRVNVPVFMDADFDFIHKQW
ncbi:hypothetical protein BsWGS_00073 [Bradybaena similaris]